MGFDENGIPLFESKYFLLHENATVEEKCKTIEHICSFAKATMELYGRWKNCQQLKSLKENPLPQYSSENIVPKNEKEYLDLPKEGNACTIYCPVLVGFDENGNPLFESKYILLHENATIEEKCEIINRLCSGAKAIIKLNRRIKIGQEYKAFREAYLHEYIFELAQEENQWIREQFFPEIKIRKRENKKDFN